MSKEVCDGCVCATARTLTSQEMASESVRAMNEKIAMENLFKAKAVGETQVGSMCRVRGAMC